ncbi:MAG: hypothetical protein WKF30_07925, partial [Pyrinomonadaceae bacterium]
SEESEEGERQQVTPATMRIVGAILIALSAVVGILSLKRVADLDLKWLCPLLLLCGVALFMKARP